ncbi:hypothetical protein ABZ897_00140 [Nonomuraea sp. NPDC046802]|uniref:hypothetical protein n=1 Tax=Nonomuraea sp. NPDC046802 TaxID=3154919 RepID=UPI003407FB5B
MQGVRPLRSGDPSSVGPYEVTGFLGEGGQGSVYLELSPSGEQVAIKLLHARFAEDEQAMRRFRRESAPAPPRRRLPARPAPCPQIPSLGKAPSGRLPDVHFSPAFADYDLLTLGLS